MKSIISNHYYRTMYYAFSLFIICALVIPNNSVAQTPDKDKEAAASVTKDAASKESSEDTKSEEGKEASTEEDPDDGLVAVNLKGVNIDNLVKFLSEITGKAVLKHKDVNVKVTIYSEEKVTPKRAFSLVSDALMLEKIAIVEDRETIKIIPASMLKDIVVDLQPEDSEDAVGGIIKTIIPIQFAEVKEIEVLIKPLMSPTGILLVHPTSRKIIITDTAQRVASIKQIIAEVDMPDTHQRKVKVFELKHATAEEIAPLLKSVLTTISAKSGGAVAPPKPGRPPQPNQKKGQSSSGGDLEVVAYKTANWVVVVASEELIQAAIGLVTEFDREKDKDLTLHTLFIEFADPGEIARELSSVFSKGPNKRVKDMVEITSDSRSNSLIILSSEENFARIKEIVQKIDTEESVKLKTKTYELQYADSEDIAEQMNELYQGLEDNSRSWWSSRSSKKDDKTRFVAETRTNSVIAIGRPTEFAKIDEMIVKLDQPINEDEVRPRIFKLKFLDAKEVTDVLNDVFGAEDTESVGGYFSWYGGNEEKSNKIGRLYGKVNFVTVPSNNAIIVMTNNTQNFKIIGDFIAELDQVSTDAGNTIVIKLKYAQATELADKINALYAKQGSRMPQGQAKEGEERTARPAYYSWLYGSPKDKDDKRTISNLIGQVRVVPDQRTNSLMITTAAQNFMLLRDLIDKLDIESPKVLVSVRLLEVTTTKTRRVGTRYGSGVVFENEDLDNGLLSNFGLSWNEISHNGSLETSAGIDINLLVQFLRRNSDTRILSDTTISMNNNEKGNIFVGAEIPFITNSQNTPQGGVNNSFEYRDAGTKLEITPNINSLDKVEMVINLEASQIRQGEIILGGQIIDTRKFNTNIAVADGDTVVIGGIMRESQSDSVRAVPIIGKIPIVNLLFRKKDKNHEVTELIAFITPEIIRDQKADKFSTEKSVKKLENIHEWRPFGGDAVEPEKKDFFSK